MSEVDLIALTLRFVAAACTMVQAWQLGGAIGTALFLFAPADAPLRRNEVKVSDEVREEAIRSKVGKRARNFGYAWVVALACVATYAVIVPDVQAVEQATNAQSIWNQ